MDKPSEKDELSKALRNAMRQIVENGGGFADVEYTLAGIPWIVTVRVDTEKLRNAIGVEYVDAVDGVQLIQGEPK